MVLKIQGEGEGGGEMVIKIRREKVKEGVMVLKIQGEGLGGGRWF